MPSFSRLALDSKVNIFSFLGKRDLLAVSCVSKEWKEIIDKNFTLTLYRHKLHKFVSTSTELKSISTMKMAEIFIKLGNDSSLIATKHIYNTRTGNNINSAIDQYIQSNPKLAMEHLMSACLSFIKSEKATVEEKVAYFVNFIQGITKKPKLSKYLSEDSIVEIYLCLPLGLKNQMIIKRECENILKSTIVNGDVSNFNLDVSINKKLKHLGKNLATFLVEEYLRLCKSPWESLNVKRHKFDTLMIELQAINVVELENYLSVEQATDIVIALGGEKHIKQNSKNIYSHLSGRDISHKMAQIVNVNDNIIESYIQNITCTEGTLKNKLEYFTDLVSNENLLNWLTIEQWATMRVELRSETYTLATADHSLGKRKRDSIGEMEKAAENFIKSNQERFSKAFIEKRLEQLTSAHISLDDKRSYLRDVVQKASNFSSLKEAMEPLIKKEFTVDKVAEIYLAVGGDILENLKAFLRAYENLTKTNIETHLNAKYPKAVEERAILGFLYSITSFPKPIDDRINLFISLIRKYHQADPALLVKWLPKAVAEEIVQTFYPYHFTNNEIKNAMRNLTNICEQANNSRSMFR